MTKSFKRPKLADSVFDEFLAMMRDGRLRPEQRLPAERDLAISFGVSRATVRSAVQRLALLGYLDVRQGDGTVVISPDENAIAQPFHSLLMAEPHLAWDLLDFRRMLEPEAARFAAQRRSDVDVLALEKCLERQAIAVSRGESLAKEDEVFHASIIEIARNGIVVRLLDVLRVLLSSLRTNVLAGVEPARTLDQHRLIVDSIREGNDVGAYQAMVAHLDWVVATARRLEFEHSASVEQNTSPEPDASFSTVESIT